MKLYLTILLLLLSYCTGQTWGQPNQIQKLNKVAAAMSGKRYFERMIPLGYVSSPNQTDKNTELWFRREHTYMYLKFAFENAMTDEGQTCLIGQVFMSERYQERDYRSHINTVSINDNHGINLYCKLFYDRKNMGFRLHIYPDLATNVCKTKMHGNGSACDKMDKQSALELHRQKICRFVSLPDAYYWDFMPASVRPYLLTGQQPAVLTKKDIENNYSKQIKCFSITETDDENTVENLSLEFTKYAYSDDLLENASYEFTGKTFGISHADTSHHLTENNWNRTLIQSEYPDDLPLNDLNLDFTNWYHESEDGKKRIYLDAKLAQRQIELDGIDSKIKDLEDTRDKTILLQSTIQKRLDGIGRENITYSEQKQKIQDSIEKVTGRVTDLAKSRDDVETKMKRVFRDITDVKDESTSPVVRKTQISINEADDEINAPKKLTIETFNEATHSLPNASKEDFLTILSTLSHLERQLGEETIKHVLLKQSFEELVKAIEVNINANNVDSQLLKKYVSKIYEDSAAIVKLKEERSVKATVMETKNDAPAGQWMFIGISKVEDTLKFANGSPDQVTTFLSNNIKKVLALRDNRPIEIEKYYYRASVVNTLEVRKEKHFKNQIDVQNRNNLCAIIKTLQKDTVSIVYLDQIKPIGKPVSILHNGLAYYWVRLHIQPSISLKTKEKKTRVKKQT